MNLPLAIRVTEIMMALAFLQQSAEHMVTGKGERRLFLPRIILCGLLLCGWQVQWDCLALALLSLFILKRLNGPYNGGSDRMGLLILYCVTAVHFMPSHQAQEYVFGYLAMQLVLSYFMAGWVKIVNPEWRSGRALADVFRFSAYPVSESLRGWADKPRLLWWMSWAVMLFELLFPLALFNQPMLIAALIIATLFHLANACLFGLNRFFWIWLAAYPSLLWLEGRLFVGG